MYFFGDTYFPGALLKNVFQIVFCIFILTECVILISTAVKGHRNSGEKSKSDHGSMLLMIAGYVSVIFVNPFLVQRVHFVLPFAFFWVGMLITAVGVFVRVYSVWTLGRYFTPTVQVNSNQTIVQSGPYKYIRHPAYAGSMVGLVGISVSFRSPLGILVSLLILAAIYGYRIKIEENVLEKSFGPEYRIYESHTWRIIPHVW